MPTLAKSYCRMCFGFCGVDVTLDDDGRITDVRGDHDNPASLGYACVKGIESPALYDGPTRHLQPLKRVGERYEPIDIETALDEIAAKMQAIEAEHGVEALGFYRGTGAFGSAIMANLFPSFAQSIGGPLYSSATIDQSAKWVAQERLGSWNAGKDVFERSDVWLFAGMNPLVSVFSWNTPVQNPSKRMRAELERGLKMIVIDPRRTELARMAAIHLQIRPGTDAAVAAAMLQVVLANGWQDADFCAAHTQGLDALKTAVAPFTPERVAAIAGVPAEDLIAAAELFAHSDRRGSVSTGTGPDMAAHANVAEHLYECLGIVCGRFLREGESLPNPGVLVKAERRAQVNAPKRHFERAPRSRVRGAVRLMGQSATPTLPEEILTPGPGQVRALFVQGGNPVAAIPDQRKVVEAFRALELLVVVEPFHTATTALAHYILPPKLMFEHADATFSLERTNLSYPYAQYTPAIAQPPPGSAVYDEAWLCWSLCRRLGRPLSFAGQALDMDTPPDDEALLEILAKDSNVPFDEVRRSAQAGRLFDVEARSVLPPDDKAGRFALMPDDVAAELHTVLEASARLPTGFDLSLVVRRVREVCNAAYRDLPTARRRGAWNPLCAHPDDLERRGLADGDPVEVISDNGRIPAIVRADASLRPGVVSLTHGYGGLPDEAPDYRAHGSNVAELISLDRDCETLQAMPRMSGVPVRIERRREVATAS